MDLSQSKNKQWSLLQKIAFKFAFSYFIIFILLMFLASFFETPLRWFAEYILNWGTNFEIQSTGSGDRTYDYVKLGLNITLALLVGTAWSILDKKQDSNNTLHTWFLRILRLSLFLAMLVYGLAKIFKGQFPDPSLELLLQPVGDMSPMGLAWTFMGHSMAYNIFIGTAEILGGTLLLYRKTTTLGGMIIFGVMTNVSIMNFTYDIPVKLFSIHLILMASVLLYSDRHRILNVFFRNKATEKIDPYTTITNTTSKKIISGIKFLLLILISSVTIIQCFIQFDVTEQLKSKSEFYGIWESEQFVKNNDTLAPLLTDSFRWRYLIINYKRKAVIKKMDTHIERYQFEINEEEKEILFSNDIDSLPQKFSYTFINPQQLVLQGIKNGDSLQITFKRKLETDFRLLNRKFHWVNESTYKY